MPANHIIDHDLKLIITIWEGDAVDTAFTEALRKYQSDIQNDPDLSGYNEILDLTKTSTMRLSSEVIEHLSELAAATDNERGHRRLAIVTTSPLVFGLARMYAIYRGLARHNKKEVRVYTNHNAAYGWIKGR